VANFINVLDTCFLYESLFGSFILVSKPKHSFVSLGSNILYKKCARKMLMKLTTGQVISKENASPLVLVIPTNEELVIASETLKEIL